MITVAFVILYFFIFPLYLGVMLPCTNRQRDGSSLA